MTYMDAEIVPGPRLNLVLGPNGTGKSSMVNAICLGLAGNTSLLGRADNVRDFVRRGESSGFVQIWLTTGKRPNEVTNIKRTLDARENSSEWRIDGATKNMRDVKALVKSLNVQLDNLCQFLPQDKVVEFAKLKPVDLLLETEKAVGDSSLHGKHEMLILQRNELQRLEQTTSASEAELALQEKANEGLTRDVERFQKRHRLEQEVDSLTDKLVWTKYREFKDRSTENEEKLGLTRGQLGTKRAQLDALVEPRMEKEKKRGILETACKTNQKLLVKMQKDIEAVKENVDTLSRDAEEKGDKLSELDEMHAKNEAQITKLSEEVEKLKEESGAVQVQQTQTQAPDHSAELNDLKLQKRDACVTVRGYESRRDEIRQEAEQVSENIVSLLEQQRRLSNVKLQKLKQLEVYNKGILALTTWLDDPDSRNMFKGKVYGPILCEVTVDKAMNASYLEQHCPRDLWARFVTEFPEDQTLLGKIAKERFNYRPVVTNYGGNVQEVIRHRFGEASSYAARFHIDNTLDEVFTAPQTVKLAMCHESNLSETYCGTARTNAEEFLNANGNIQRLLTPESVYMVRISKYNRGARSMNVAPLRPAQLLSVSDNTDVEAEKRQLRDMLAESQEKKVALAQEQAEVENEIGAEQERIEGIDAEAKRLTDETNALKNKRSKLMTSMKTKEKALANAKSKPDPREEAPAIHAEILEMQGQICTQIERLEELYAELLNLHRKCTVAECSRRELESQIKSMTRDSKKQADEVTQVERLVKQLEDCIAQEDIKLRQLQSDALERTGPLNREIKRRFKEISARGQEAIEVAINSKRDEIDAIQMANPRAMEEYNIRQGNMARMRESLTRQQDELSVKKQEVEVLKAEWLPELKDVVREINKNFGRSFKKIGCSGEVELHEEVDPETGLHDFAHYAIHIKVKFRAEEDLQLLTAHRQSGGERSVSTIFYLIAIQNVTKCPFRVVDEINQGMDPVNERKVFTQLVEAACQPGTPQCFLLTPKLLPNLPYSQHVKLLEIYNGTLISKVANGFQKEQIIGGRLPLATAA